MINFRCQGWGTLLTIWPMMNFGKWDDKTYIIISPQSKTYGCYIERICDEVSNIPHVTDILFKANIPELLDFTPD